MIWVVIDRACQTIFLILALTILGLLFNNTYQNRLVDSTLSQLEAYKEENDKIRAVNIARLESRMNSLESNQDSYQLSTTKRIDSIENRYLIEKDRLDKRINNHNSKLNYWIDKNKDRQLQEKLKQE